MTGIFFYCSLDDIRTRAVYRIIQCVLFWSFDDINKPQMKTAIG